MKKYSFSLVDANDNQTLTGVYKLWTDAYGPDEIEPIEETRAGMRGEADVLYRIFAAKDEDGNVVAAIAGGVDDLNPTESIYMIGYMNTDPAHQRQGLAKELFGLAIKQAAADASKQSKTLAVISGEATSDSEAFWNSVGLRRLYAKDATTYTELEYVQPALDFNLKTGLPADGVGEAFEHLMLAGIHQELSNAPISDSVAAIYQWSHRWDEEEFSSKKAYAAHVMYVDEFQKEFDLQLEGAEIVQLSIEERKNLVDAGATVIEFDEADEE